MVNSCASFRLQTSGFEVGFRVQVYGLWGATHLGGDAAPLRSADEMQDADEAETWISQLSHAEFCF